MRSGLVGWLAAPPEAPVVLSPLEVAVVRGWFDDLTAGEIARRAEVRCADVAKAVQLLRRRGVDLPDRPAMAPLQRRKTGRGRGRPRREAARG